MFLALTVHSTQLRDPQRLRFHRRTRQAIVHSQSTYEVLHRPGAIERACLLRPQWTAESSCPAAPGQSAGPHCDRCDRCPARLLPVLRCPIAGADSPISRSVLVFRHSSALCDLVIPAHNADCGPGRRSASARHAGICCAGRPRLLLAAWVRQDPDTAEQFTVLARTEIMQSPDSAWGACWAQHVALGAAPDVARRPRRLRCQPSHAKAIMVALLSRQRQLRRSEIPSISGTVRVHGPRSSRVDRVVSARWDWRNSAPEPNRPRVGTVAQWCLCA